MYIIPKFEQGFYEGQFSLAEDGSYIAEGSWSRKNFDDGRFFWLQSD